jgi:hypothetical protein
MTQQRINGLERPMSKARIAASQEHLERVARIRINKQTRIVSVETPHGARVYCDTDFATAGRVLCCFNHSIVAGESARV